MNTKNTMISALALLALGAPIAVAAPAMALPEEGPGSARAVEMEDLTASEVDMLPVEVDEDATGDQVVEAAEAEDETPQSEYRAETGDDGNAAAARVELNSDIAVVGVTWDPGEVNPERIEIRLLEDGSWSAWQELSVENSLDVETVGGTAIGSTDAMTLTNVSAIEVVARGNDIDMDDLVVNVIDPRGEDPVENGLAGRNSNRADVQESEEGSDEEALPEESAEETPEGSEEEPPEDELAELTGERDDRLPQEIDVEGLHVGEPFTAETASFAAPISAALSADGTKFATGKNGLTVTTRKGWGANEGYRYGYVSPNVTFKGAVVHHTAGSNNYTREQVPGQIQGIYYYHAVTLDWGDVGYHFLVDKYGGVWEGRYRSLSHTPKGAHAYGANSETFGVSVLGTYTDQAPPQVAQDAVAKTIAWQFGVHKITNPTGTIRVPGGDLAGRTVGTISGHRDIGATACPGQAFYNRLGSVRTSVVNYMKTPAPTPAPTPSVPGPTKWDPGMIISDAVFYNPSAMTEAQINTFINDKGASCSNGNGTTCLKNTKFPTQNLTTDRGGCKPLTLTGSQTPAKIIAETAKACGINPQVILVMLQKESSGITQPNTADRWAKAMGSGCPTGQSCDAGQAGFAKQIYYGADKLVSYPLKPDSWPYVKASRAKTAVTIPYNSNTACGGQSVVIKNDATAALYTYTPYIPNAAALNSYPGPGDSCSHTGWRNFHHYMNEWFNGGNAGGSSAAPTPKWDAPQQIGHGWSGEIVYPGDWNKTGTADLMMIDSAGDLWFYQGNGRGGFAMKRKIGNGWQVMDKVIGGADWNGDGNVDLLARRADTGDLLLYPGNGLGGFKTPYKIGNGWSGMRDITVTTNRGVPTIYAMDATRLYAYPGTGSGGFKAPRPMGTGWGAMDQISSVGDWSNDGNSDLIARNKNGDLYLYAGDSSGMFGAGVKIGNGWQVMKRIGVSQIGGGYQPMWPVTTQGLLMEYRFRGM